MTIAPDASRPANDTTPTVNASLALRPGGFSCLADALDYAARGETGLNFHDGFGRLTALLSYRDLCKAARETAARMRALDLRRGGRVAIVAETSPEFIVLFYACQYAGLVACPLPPQQHSGGRDAWLAQTARLVAACAAEALVTPAALYDAPFVTGSPTRALTYAQIFSAPACGPLEPLGPDEPAYAQFSSGSTSAPKGLLISQRGLAANVTAILRHGLQIRMDDRAFSWLPLHHDMGLVGFSIAALCAQRSVDYIAPSTFARRPLLWLQMMTRQRSTITYAPDFAYRLAAERFERLVDAATRATDANVEPPPFGTGAVLRDEIDLSSLRIAGVGGDMIRADVLAHFTQQLRRCGFSADSFLPSYGMAEATLAISIGVPGEPLTIDRHKIQVERTFIACGKPLPGVDVVVTDDVRAPLPVGEIGHVLVRTPGLARCTLDAPAQSLTNAEGYFHTGDLGYLRSDGALVVTGRSKDLLIVRGRNLWPQDIEWLLERTLSLSSGEAAAISVPGADGDTVVVLIRCGLSDPAARLAVCDRATSVIGEALGVTARIVLVPPHGLPFTSSGKLARHAARARYLAGEYGEVVQAA
jgi:fatty-acyl-CoA synthase